MKDRKQRVRYKAKKVSNRKRLSVFRSNNHIYAQLIDDDKGITVASSWIFNCNPPSPVRHIMRLFLDE